MRFKIEFSHNIFSHMMVRRWFLLRIYNLDVIDIFQNEMIKSQY